MDEPNETKQQAQTRYVDGISFLSQPINIDDRYRLAGATDLLLCCDALLKAAPLHLQDRWPHEKKYRIDISHRVARHLPSEWPDREAWSETIQQAVKTEEEYFSRGHRSVLNDWATWAELESDIHVAVHCSRETVLLFYCDKQHLPENTSVFLVPDDFRNFVSELISGDLTPLWASQVESTDTPGCIHGFLPKYKPLR
ncbi:Uncharacterised protein [Klebsiella oxytoca]|nr:Uncharacterised protein [Klebsiella oxytoca]